MENNDFIIQHRRMVTEQIIKRGITEEKLIQAVYKVPRHSFVPEEYKSFSYSDSPLPIGFGQTISQPYIVALMISELQLTGDEHILEIGTGCGYQTAILSHLVSEVISLEIIPELAERAKLSIASLQIKNVKILISDGSMGWIEDAPYDAIIVSAAARVVPEPLLEQLADGGRLVMPVGSRSFQQLEVWKRYRSSFTKTTGIPVAFVPLVGKFGFKN